MESFKITNKDDRINVYTPYNADFVTRVKRLGGRWNASDKSWSLPIEATDNVRSAMRDVYGRDDQPVTDTVDVILRFYIDIKEDRASVTIFGRDIARAFGRDSGAVVCDDIIFIEGGPKSGGSMKYWQTVIPSGSVVKMLRVPKAAVSKDALPMGVEMEIVSEQIDREALEAEKARLIARLAEIDRLLGM